MNLGPTKLELNQAISAFPPAPPASVHNLFMSTLKQSKENKTEIPTVFRQFLYNFVPIPSSPFYVGVKQKEERKHISGINTRLLSLSQALSKM